MNSRTPASTSRVVIVVATDGTPASSEALAAAARFASLPGSELHLIHVLDSRDAALEGVIAQTQTMLEGTAEKHGLQSASLHIAVGVAWREIVELASDLGADMIVVGSHGRTGLDRFLLGSVSENVVSKAGCAVFVARAKTAAALPEIEAPCSACLAVQEATRGEKLWCERHAARHARARLHYEFGQGYGAGSQLLR